MTRSLTSRGREQVSDSLAIHAATHRCGHGPTTLMRPFAGACGRALLGAPARGRAFSRRTSAWPRSRHVLAHKADPRPPEPCAGLRAGLGRGTLAKAAVQAVHAKYRCMRRRSRHFRHLAVVGSRPVWHLCVFADKMAAPNKGVIKAVVSCDTIIVMGVPQVQSGHVWWESRCWKQSSAS